MKIFVRKSKTAMISEVLNVAINLGNNVAVSCFIPNSEDLKKSIFVYREGTEKDFLIQDTLQIDGYAIASKKLINFLLTTTNTHETETSYIWVIEPEYAKHLGVEFGYPKENSLGLPFLEGRFEPQSGDYYRESFGNEFNGGSTIYPTETWESETITDIVGTICKTEYRKPGRIDGWGSGFKGGFFIVSNE